MCIISTGMPFDVNGLLFTTVQNSGGYLEPLGEFARQLFAVGVRLVAKITRLRRVENLSVIATPELSTWALMLLGFAGLSYVGHRRARRPLAATDYESVF